MYGISNLLTWFLLTATSAVFSIDEIKRLCVNPSRPDLGRREKIKLNFYCHTSLW